MGKYMDQSLFNVGAYALAKNYVQETSSSSQSSGTFESKFEDLCAFYKNSYKEDNFSRQWEQIVPELDKELKCMDYFIDAKERMKAFDLYSQLAREYNPDGTKIFKFLGIFGGTMFAKSVKDPGVRPDICKSNLISYYNIGEKLTFGSEYFDRSR